jgi:hypothetical protein
MQFKKILLSIAIVMLVSMQVYPQLKAIESFDYPLGTSLDTLAGNGGSGWAGPWDLIGGNSEVMAVVDTGFAYGDLNYPVPHVGKLFMGANQSAWGWQRYLRNFSQRWPNEAGKVYWISSFFELKKFTTSGWALLTPWDSKVGDGINGGLGHSWGNDTIGINVTGGYTSYTVNDGPQWLVAKLVMSGDTLSNVYMWVSPDPNGGEPDTNSADAKGKWKMPNGFDGLAVHFGGEGAGMTMAVDEIRLGESWTDVSSPIQTVQEFKAIESFDYPVGTSLDTLAGNGGSGWAGAWDLFQGNPEVMSVTNTGLAYEDLNYSISHSGNFFMGANPVAWGYQRYGRYLAQRWPNQAGKVYWLSTLYELKDYTTNGWAIVGFFDGDQEKAGIGHEWGNDTIGVCVYNRAGHSGYTVNDGPQWLVAKVVMSGDTLSNVYLWVTPDPNGSEPDTNAADAKGRWNLVNGFDRVAVHWGGEGVGMTMAVDEIRLGESWTDVSSSLVSVEGKVDELPTKYVLSQNYPNPFNPSTKISFSIKEPGFVKLNVYNLLGQQISTIVNENLNAGNYARNFNASDLPSGIYFYKLEAGNTVLINKMMLLK